MKLFDVTIMDRSAHNERTHYVQGMVVMAADAAEARTLALAAVEVTEVLAIQVDDLGDARVAKQGSRGRYSRASVKALREMGQDNAVQWQFLTDELSLPPKPKFVLPKNVKITTE